MRVFHGLVASLIGAQFPLFNYAYVDVDVVVYMSQLLLRLWRCRARRLVPLVRTLDVSARQQLFKAPHSSYHPPPGS